MKCFKLQMELLAISGLFSLTTFLAAFLQGAMSFGLSIMFLFIYQIISMTGLFVLTDFYDLKYAVFIQNIALMVVNPCILWSVGLKKNYKMELVLPFIPVQLIGTPIGQYLHKYTPVSVLKLMIGCLTILIGAKHAFNIYKSRNQCQQKGDPEQSITSSEKCVKKVVLFMLCTGFLAGFLGGLVGVAGPPLMIFFLFFDYSSQEIRVNVALTSLINTCTRLIVYGVSLPPESAAYSTWFAKEDLSLYLSVALAGILAAQIGLAVGHYINKETFRLLLVALLITNGITMITTGAIDYVDCQFHLGEIATVEMLDI